MKRREQRIEDLIPLNGGYEGKGVQYSYDGRTLVCSRTLRSRMWMSIAGTAIAAACSYGAVELARKYVAQGLHGGEWVGVVVLPAIILVGIYVVLWANLTDAKATFDFTAGQLTIEHKGLRSLQLTEVPVKELAAVRAGFRQVQTDAAEMQSTGRIIYYLTLTFQDGAELRLFETADEQVVNDSATLFKSDWDWPWRKACCPVPRPFLPRACSRGQDPVECWRRG